MNYRNVIIIHQIYHIVSIVLLYIALTGTSWEIIESNSVDPNFNNSRVEYGLWKVCQNTRTEKTCNDINPVSDEVTTARVFMVIATITVILIQTFLSVF